MCLAFLPLSSDGRCLSIPSKLTQMHWTPFSNLMAETETVLQIFCVPNTLRITAGAQNRILITNRSVSQRFARCSRLASIERIMHVIKPRYTLCKFFYTVALNCFAKMCPFCFHRNVASCLYFWMKKFTSSNLCFYYYSRAFNSQLFYPCVWRICRKIKLPMKYQAWLLNFLKLMICYRMFVNGTASVV
jgi:hypothetical protein